RLPLQTRPPLARGRGGAHGAAGTLTTRSRLSHMALPTASAQGGTMTRDAFAVSSMLVLVGLTACSTGPRTASSGGHEPGMRTITIGATMLDPPDLTMRAEQALGLSSISGSVMQLEFIGPKTDQASKITCRPKDPAKAKGAEAAWTTIQTNPEGHLVANVAP